MVRIICQGCKTHKLREIRVKEQNPLSKEAHVDRAKGHDKTEPRIGEPKRDMGETRRGCLRDHRIS